MTNSRRRIALFGLAFAALVQALPRTAAAIDLLEDNIQFAPYSLVMRPYATIPFGLKNVISMTTRKHDPRLYVTLQEGAVFAIDENPNGTTSSSFFFDAVASVEQATGRHISGSGGQDGLQSTAFHPEFDDPSSPGYGKFYTTLMETRPASTAGHPYLGDPDHGDSGRDSVLVEWTYNFDFQEVDPMSYREVFRARLPAGDHMIKQARFNPYAEQGDEDYGLLYVTHGDSSSQHSPEDRPQHFDTIVGKMVRINPLATETATFSVPTTNPFYGTADPNVLEVIYAYGFRNPHTFSFNPDDEGNIHILVGDIGRANIEEINLVEKGGNHGWPKREGTFIHSQNPDGSPNAGYYDGVFDLNPNEADLNLGYTYPVAQFDHNTNWDSTPVNQPFASMAVSSGFVIRNGSDPNLHNKFVFTNFAAADGNVYVTDFEDMLNAKTQLEPGDSPDDLTQAELQRVFLEMDEDNNPNTYPAYYSEYSHLLNWFRSDARFGEGVFGEMYISNKVNGVIYQVANSVPLAGDYNKDHVVDAADYTVWRNTFGEEGYHMAADGTGDGKVGMDDYDVWKKHYGDVWQYPGGGFAAGGGGTTGVPEPATLVLAATAAIALAARRKRARIGGGQVRE